MNFHGIDIICPHCRGELDRASEDEIACIACNRRYPVVLGIPDLRVFRDPYIELDEERAKAKRLAERYTDYDFAGLVEFYYSISPLVPPHHARKYARSLLAAGARARGWLETWEAACGAGRDVRSTAPRDTLLDLGCGTGPLLVAAENYSLRVGVDLAFRWLVVGKKRLMEAGLELPLICACAEALPFRNAIFTTVAADSVVEHLRDQRTSFTEVFRVMQPGGCFFLATPNRFSVGPDPQTGIWAGSLLPLSWTQAIVRRQRGLAPLRHLLSARELKYLLFNAGFEGTKLMLPSIPPGQRAHFPAHIRFLMALYDLARRLPLSRHLLLAIGPMFHAISRKPAGHA